MSAQLRRELTDHIRSKYKHSNSSEKHSILDGFIAATGYQRKHAIHLLNQSADQALAKKYTGRKPIYDHIVREALIHLWEAANYICPKRLVPFLPELICVLERHGHLSLSSIVRKKLLSISVATADRLLKIERHKQKKGISTTKPGALLKKQIQIRTFADWNDVQPGFLEGDLVAHCGEYVDGSFLNTFVLTDIASGWTEFLPLLYKSASHVIEGMNIMIKLLPFPLLGIDTDNGSEFINYELFNFCKANAVTFTRSRAYKKNDQAHVEEKNGSIVRRAIGYDRYEGKAAWYALAELYAILRLYVNYFQPSLKLISKKRDGSKVTKKYDRAQTPCQRLCSDTSISEKHKACLMAQYEKLDPLDLLCQLKKRQEIFWQYAGIRSGDEPGDHLISSPQTVDHLSQPASASNDQTCSVARLNHTPYQRIKKIKKYTEKMPRIWRTRKDDFAAVWNKLQQQLENNPHQTAKTLLDELIVSQPSDFHVGQLRTLQRRVAEWRSERNRLEKATYLAKVNSSSDTHMYLSLVIGSGKE